jgi:hypothetical protein
MRESLVLLHNECTRTPLTLCWVVNYWVLGSAETTSTTVRANENTSLELVTWRRPRRMTSTAAQRGDGPVEIIMTVPGGVSISCKIGFRPNPDIHVFPLSDSKI